MQIEKIRLFQFRNYEEITIDLHSDMNIFVGKNGSGKTNILEAINYCAIGKSHRAAADTEVIKKGKEEALCESVVKDNLIKYDISVHFKRGNNIKKEIQINHEKIKND